mmetsp:Transcript_20260/g.51176  ORF Transcript_20260/g.51176 Transcript_20260/m.51176 type:complete len:357 (+) Transcript_20260:261-1331(+)
MLGHRTPWSAVQSVIDVSRTAARAVHSLGLARPSAFSSTAAQTTHNRETTSSNFTVNHTCASIAINSTATDVDECASKCLNYYFADKGMSPDDIFVDEEVSNMTQMDMTSWCRSSLPAIQDFVDACPGTFAEEMGDLVGEETGSLRVVCDRLQNGGLFTFTIDSMCQRMAAEQAEGAVDTCKDACLDFFLEWVSLSGDADLQDGHVMESLQVFENVTTEDYDSDAYLTAFNVTRVCSEAAINAFDDFVTNCPDRGSEDDEGDDEDEGGDGAKILDALSPTHHRDMCSDAEEAEGASVAVYVVVAVLLVLGLVGGGAFVFVNQGAGGVEAMAGAEGAEGEAADGEEENGEDEDEFEE